MKSSLTEPSAKPSSDPCQPPVSDLFGAQTSATSAADLALGVDALDLRATLHDDALDARLELRSTRGGRAQGTLSLGAVAGAPSGRIARKALQSEPLPFAWGLP